MLYSRLCETPCRYPESSCRVDLDGVYTSLLPQTLKMVCGGYRGQETFDRTTVYLEIIFWSAGPVKGSNEARLERGSNDRFQLL